MSGILLGRVLRGIASSGLGSKAIRRVPTASMSTGPTLDLSGVYPPIATPFDVDENIDYEKLKFNMEKWNEAPFRGTSEMISFLSHYCSVTRPLINFVFMIDHVINTC